MSATPVPQPAAANSHRSASPLHDLVYGHIHASALRAVVVHRIPDRLADAPLTAEQLAADAGIQAGPLHRVLRLLAVRGIFQQDAGGAFALTSAGHSLRTDMPGSQRDAVLLFTDPMFRRSAESLEDTLRTGAPGFDSAYGLPLFDHLSSHPDDSRLFDTAMSSLTSGVNEQIADSYPFPGTGRIVDVAGGRGGLLRAVLTRHPGLTGLLFDRPETVTDHLLGTAELADRWQTEGGDIFTAVPASGDLYLLKNVLHDWPDEDCLRILTSIRRAAATGTKLLVIDAVLPDDGTPHPAIALDIVMLMTLRGRERTHAEFERLLSGAGFRINRTVRTPALTSIIEAEAV
ncbi:methyltransferase [Streptomyces sp. NBC_01023]|uniref:methyltransferase n=1 Tax=Streptomyces sp. NBC_01023 TaxID=2903724 RepID=UPI0038690A1F|nr:methyltransferase [Streptomyces sp. NBC_01023]